MAHQVVLRSNLQTENFVTIRRAAIRFEEEVLTSTSLCQHRCGVETPDAPSQAEAVMSQIPWGANGAGDHQTTWAKGKVKHVQHPFGFFVCFV